MNKRAQVVIIILWILAILAIIAVGVGHRVSMAVRLTAYQRDGAKALALAQAGVNKAIIELERDASGSVDSLRDTWSTGIDSENKKSFETIEVKSGSGETFTVKYLYDKENNTYFCMADEERKININIANQKLLEELLKECGVTSPETITKNILSWRGEPIQNPPDDDYDALGYKNKGTKFANTEELALVAGIKGIGDTEPENLEKLMRLVTALDDKSKVNINTAGAEVLKILFTTAGAADTLDFGKIDVDSLIEKIIKYRNNTDIEKTNLFNISVDLDLTEDEKNFVNNVQSKLDELFQVKSNYFRIISTGKVAPSGIERAIECVYDRGNKKVVFWHEN